jgi:hypothetical protein
MRDVKGTVRVEGIISALVDKYDVGLTEDIETLKIALTLHLHEISSQQYRQGFLAGVVSTGNDIDDNLELPAGADVLPEEGL